MGTTSHEDFFAAMASRSIVAEIDRRIFLTESNTELAELAAILIARALNILTLLSPSEVLKTTIIDAIDKKGDRYNDLISTLEVLTSSSTLLK